MTTLSKSTRPTSIFTSADSREGPLRAYISGSAPHRALHPIIYAFDVGAEREAKIARATSHVEAGHRDKEVQARLVHRRSELMAQKIRIA